MTEQDARLGGAEHEQLRELIAAHALDALEDTEAAEASRAIASHLARCADCRDLLDGFRAVAADLALEAGSRRPPRALSSRVLGSARSPRPAVWARVAVAAALVAVLGGVTAWSAHLTGRVHRAERAQATTTELLATVSHPASHVVTLASETASRAASVRLAATYIPGRGLLYVFGSMPDPAEDRVYQVWVEKAGRFSSLGTFRPEAGAVILRVPVEAARYDRLLITEEPSSGSARPSSRHVVIGSL